MIYYLVTFIVAAFFALGARADDQLIKFNFNKTDLASVLEDYAKASGEHFIWDEQLAGKVTITNPTKIGLEEAFAQLSSALAAQGFGISRQGQVMIVQRARMIERNFIDVGTTLPPLRPERMFTWIVDLKHADASQVNREVRTLASKDGELVPVTASNQLIITDWVSNLHRVQKIIEAIDRPARDEKTAAAETSSHHVPN